VNDTAAAAESDKSIAVLPFVNISSDAEQEYFSDGLSEDLLNLLAKIPNLRVIARTSSFAYKGKDVSITDIARELNVAHVLEGSVRKSGNQVRITAQLIRASDSSHLWSESYDRSLDDVFAIQDEISAAVVEQLKITLLGAAPLAEKVNPEVYSLVLQARYFRSKGGEDNLAEAALAYRQALDIDPGYAAAWAGLAGVTMTRREMVISSCHGRGAGTCRSGASHCAEPRARRRLDEPGANPARIRVELEGRRRIDAKSVAAGARQQRRVGVGGCPGRRARKT
jgi:TolB-like protein